LNNFISSAKRGLLQKLRGSEKVSMAKILVIMHTLVNLIEKHHSFSRKTAGVTAPYLSLYKYFFKFISPTYNTLLSFVLQIYKANKIFRENKQYAVITKNVFFFWQKYEI
jgi:hypothetical protein